VQFTIERIRTLVLVCGALLIVALGVFLTIGRFKSPFNHRDVPRRLGIDIEQEANGVTYTQAHGGHTLFKIHASKVVQLKNDHALLHDVQIDLYSADGSSVDRIVGDEFEYDQKEGKATASGPVEITLVRPTATKSKAKQPPVGKLAAGAAPAKNAVDSDIHVKTSGVAFDQKSGMVTTAQRVDFSMRQGSGSSMGATYDSKQGFLMLDRAVELTAHPATSSDSSVETVAIRAGHAEFYRDTNLCLLRAASAEYRGDHAEAANAQILFREDGTAVRLEATGGLTLATPTGGRIAAPVGSMDFDERNQPQHAHLEGGVTIDSVNDARTVHGTSPTMELEFAAQGELRHAHLERGVEMHSEENRDTVANGQSVPVRLSRIWRSPVADVEFRSAGQKKVEPSTLRGTGGVILSGLTQRGNAVPLPSRFAADDVTGEFGPDSALTAMTGTGHASMEETAATGVHELANGDRLQAQFAPPGQPKEAGGKSAAAATAAAAQVQSAVLDGHVVLVQQPAAKPGATQPAEMRATASQAAYEGAGQWLHLTGNPRVENGGLQLSADRIDVSQESGDAFARGNVKGTWINSSTNSSANSSAGAANGRPRANSGDLALGGSGPTHVIADEAQLQRATDQATFRGNVRLWQQVNSVAAPMIVLDRQKQTLVAQTANAATPVTAVMVSTGNRKEGAAAGGEAKPANPSVIRVHGGDLWYSDVERRAVMQAGILRAVTAETPTATSVSSRVELQLTPAASHATGQAQVELMTASGHVVVSSQGRRGTGEQLVYTGADGKYRLTGNADELPRMTDPERGTVTGEALIFNSRDDSVSIEGGAQETRTETTAPKPD
jgi:lipopolysaccharide export system protein LptA